MRKSISILAIVAALFMVFSCQKESTTVLRATINQYNGNDGKAYLAADDYVNWHVGDTLWVNGHKATVTGSASPFTVEVEDLEENTQTFFAVFPMANSTMSGNSATVTIPAVQTYEADAAGKQILNAPMAAKQVRNANGVTTLMFYNLASLFEISLPGVAEGTKIKNIEVYNIANNFGTDCAAINGTYTVDFTQTPIAIGNATTNGTHVTTLNVNQNHESNRNYYVILPPVENAQFQVVVHYEAAENYQSTSYYDPCIAQVKQADNTNNLPANMIAPITLTSNNTYKPYVSDGTNAYFVAPGNVQCWEVNSTATQYRERFEYRFAEHQWDIVGAANLTSGGDRAFPLDLFPYGQTGDPLATTFPREHRTDMVDFVQNASGIPCAFKIGNNNIEWRIPHMDPAMAVFTKRGGTPGGGNSHNMNFGQDASVATITVNNQSYRGVIVLPDEYPGAHFKVGDGSWDITIGAEQWMLMESLGATFLPCAGQIMETSHGHYEWRGNHSNGMAFYTLKDPFNGNSVNYFIFADANDLAYITPRTGAEHARSYRLIRPAPGVTVRSLTTFNENDPNIHFIE